MAPEETKREGRAALPPAPTTLRAWHRGPAMLATTLRMLQQSPVANTRRDPRPEGEFGVDISEEKNVGSKLAGAAGAAPAGRARAAGRRASGSPVTSVRWRWRAQRNSRVAQSPPALPTTQLAHTPSHATAWGIQRPLLQPCAKPVWPLEASRPAPAAGGAVHEGAGASCTLTGCNIRPTHHTSCSTPHARAKRSTAQRALMS